MVSFAYEMLGAWLHHAPRSPSSPLLCSAMLSNTAFPLKLRMHFPQVQSRIVSVGGNRGTCCKLRTAKTGSPSWTRSAAVLRAVPAIACTCKVPASLHTGGLALVDFRRPRPNSQVEVVSTLARVSNCDLDRPCCTLVFRLSRRRCDTHVCATLIQHIRQEGALPTHRLTMRRSAPLVKSSRQDTHEDVQRHGVSKALSNYLLVTAGCIQELPRHLTGETMQTNHLHNAHAPLDAVDK